MSLNRFLEQLGVYFRQDFVDADERRRLIELVREGGSSAAGVYDVESGSRLDEKTRRVSEATQLSEGVRFLKSRLRELLPELAERFDTPLDKLEGPTFLTYQPGDFFLPHCDHGEGDVEGRRVTAVVYLNGPASAEAEGEGYAGADLTLYGLMDFAGAEHHGLTVQGAPGLLVAFPSTLLHGVSELTQGVRYCAVAWFR